MNADRTRSTTATGAGAGEVVNNSGIAALPPGFFLFLNFVEAVLLVLLFMGWQWEWRGFGHDKLPAVLWGVFPIVVPWAAAWGGWLVSVKGVVGYWRKSQSPDADTRNGERLEWNAWHLARVPMGIVLGTVGALLAVVFAGIVGTGDDGRLDATPLGTLTIALVAFVLGYRQESFDALVQRVIELITAKADEAVREEKDRAGDDGFLARASRFWRAPVNGTGTNSVVVSNRSDQELPLAAGAITITGKDAASFTVEAPPATVPAHGAVLLSVKFSPTEKRKYEAELEVQLGDKKETVSLTGYGNEASP